MSLSVSQSVFAMRPNLKTYFLGIGGTGPYSYAVLGGGAGGSIDSVTGQYTAPVAVNPDPKFDVDRIQVTDSLAATAIGQILIANPLQLFCDIIQQGMGLASGRVFLWDQKIFQPQDAGLFVVVSEISSRPFGNTLTPDGSGGGVQAIQSLNMMTTLSIDAISRGPEARDRKEEILLALNSIYSQSQQTTNSFNIGKLPAGSRFINISNEDGAAILYRYNISINMQYAFTKAQAVPYFDDFSTDQVNTNP